ncbi:WAT1-related protein At4g30420-like isoform X2 [Oryza brachyantha]|uniref:WAT1-related protein At4g30420-like isoform X2 n=1 Tax=Oryza brachyantha TaxID=4533 RepID=UPI001AD9F939|nr:WAT1-related protein At4g30420-like isoform X2 [Oryza brachyantha]
MGGGGGGGGGGGVRTAAREWAPCAAMVAAQCIYAAMTLFAKAMFGRGVSPVIFVVYRQAIGTLVLVPITVVSNSRSETKDTRSLGTTGFFVVFLTALVGATVNQNLTYQGLHLGSSSMASAMTNLIPAITFLMAASAGQERVNIRQRGTVAKISGTIVCVGGAMAMAFFKGPKLLNYTLSDLNMLLHSPTISKWVLGALCLVVSSSCWSLWLILQVPICKSYVDPLSLSAWTCFLSTLQCATLAVFLVPDVNAWKIHSLFELSGYVFAGAFGSGVTFYLQSWCISVRGPLYSAMFTPVCTVVATVVAGVVLREELHVGSCFDQLARRRCCDRRPVRRPVGQSGRHEAAQRAEDGGGGDAMLGSTERHRAHRR